MCRQRQKLDNLRLAAFRCVMSGADVEVYLSQVHDGSVSSGFRALYEERLLLDVTLLIEEHHFQVMKVVASARCRTFHVETEM